MEETPRHPPGAVDRGGVWRRGLRLVWLLLRGLAWLVLGVLEWLAGRPATPLEGIELAGIELAALEPIDAASSATTPKIAAPAASAPG